MLWRVTGDLPYDRLSLVPGWETTGAGQEDWRANPGRCTRAGQDTKANGRLRQGLICGPKAGPSQTAGTCHRMATSQEIPVGKVVTEVGSDLNGHRGKFLALLKDPSVSQIIVEHRDRFVRSATEYVEAALQPTPGSWLSWTQPSESTW